MKLILMDKICLASFSPIGPSSEVIFLTAMCCYILWLLFYYQYKSIMAKMFCIKLIV
jgi:hypothetical protein